MDGQRLVVNYASSEHGRKRYRTETYERKRRVLTRLAEVIVAGCKWPIKFVCREMGVGGTAVRNWKRNAAKIFGGHIGKARERRSIRPLGVGSQVAAEVELYTAFVWRVKFLRKRATMKWLRRKMKQIFRRRGEPGHKASLGWCTRFRKRFNIVNLRVTNKHRQSIQERMPEIQKFHRWLIYGLQRSAPQRCPIYGRFPPHLMWHMDQTPISFSGGSRSALCPKGHAPAISSRGGSADCKRMCTLQLSICAEPSLTGLIKLTILFRGKGARLSQVERDCYANLPNVTVRFQKKAWADEPVMMNWLVEFRQALATAGYGEVLLGMDNHGSQQTPWCRTFMDTFGIVPAFTPANCTDCVSPVDHHVAVTLKNKIFALKSEYEDKRAEEDEHFDWDECLCAADKRMLMAQWASKAWEDICLNHHHLLLAAFVKTGFLLAKDGSQNGQVELEKGGLGNYTF